MESVRKHPAEVLAEWGAPALLAAAAGWAAWTVGLSPVAAPVSAGLAFFVGLATMRLVGGTAEQTLSAFEPVLFEICGDAGADDELLLDDPLEVAPDSRVVQLFARPEATPGELVLRIEDYLGDGRRAVAPVTATDEAPPAHDASAALHAALANIRASLR